MGHTHYKEFLGPDRQKRKVPPEQPTYINTGTWTRVILLKEDASNKPYEVAYYRRDERPFAHVRITSGGDHILSNLLLWTNQGQPVQKIDFDLLNQSYKDIGYYRKDEEKIYEKKMKKAFE